MPSLLKPMNNLLWPILRQAITHPRRTAAIDDQRTWRYLDLLGGALHVADLVDRSSDAPAVALMLPTSGIFSMSLLGGWIAGRAVVPINYLLSADLRQFVIDDCGAKTLITVGPMLDYLAWRPTGVDVIELDKVSFSGLPPLRMPALPMGRDPAALVYTSGTSGKPKGVVLTHANLKHQCDAAIEHVGLSSSNGFLGVLPQFHSFGLSILTLLPLYVGAQTVFTARFVPNKLVQLIEKHQPDVFIAIPAMYNALAGVKKASPDAMKSIRFAVSGGEPLPRAVHDRFAEKFGVDIAEGYGLTETSPGVAWAHPDRPRVGSVGQVLPGFEVRIMTPDGRDVAAEGGEGEIQLRGPCIMAGYHNRPDLTAEVIDPDGWFHTGDMGRLDADGYLSITGRIKEMLIIAGENVFPREIEEVLIRHPSVHDCGVIGRGDESRGEVAVAFVELSEGETFDEAALRQWCRDGLAGYKVPRQIIQLDKLPRSPTGKVLRRELRDLLPPA